MSQAGRHYRIREFAKLAGVTVRVLQHYDRMGLLSPPRSKTGSRVYSEADFQALVQIVALKSVGIPLKKIGALQAHGPSALAETLGRQRRALERKQPVLDRVIFAVRDIEAELNRGAQADPAVLRPLMDALRKHQRTQAPEPVVARRKPAWDDLKQEWEALLAEIESAPTDDPSSPVMQRLAARWDRLMALSSDGVSYAPDLMAHAEVLRSTGTSRGVAGSIVFDRIGAALARQVAPDSGARSVVRWRGDVQR